MTRLKKKKKKNKKSGRAKRESGDLIKSHQRDGPTAAAFDLWAVKVFLFGGEVSSEVSVCLCLRCFIS